MFTYVIVELWINEQKITEKYKLNLNFDSPQVTLYSYIEYTLAAQG